MICNTYIEFFKTIAEPSRVEILFLLKEKELCVHELTEELEKEQSAISHNLKTLKAKGFVNSKTEGKHRRYNLTKEAKVMLESMDSYVKKYFHGDCKCGK